MVHMELGNARKRFYPIQQLAADKSYLGIN